MKGEGKSKKGMGKGSGVDKTSNAVRLDKLPKAKGSGTGK